MLLWMVFTATVLVDLVLLVACETASKVLFMGISTLFMLLVKVVLCRGPMEWCFKKRCFCLDVL